ncbi:MAG: UDP-3-O-acyl-N-acetylglucosamine deacetylase [Rhodospirillales bacterium]
MRLGQSEHTFFRRAERTATPHARVQLQKTLKGPIHCSGVGLHSGSRVSLTLEPAEADSGVVFLRTDMPADRAAIRADWRSVVDTRLCTVVANRHGAQVGTVEHLMAALAGCGIDNAVARVDHSEVPAMDGSAEPFVFMIECAGTVEQNAPRRAIQVLKPVNAGKDGHHASLAPAASALLSFEIDFDNPAVARQELSLTLDRNSFKSEICRARTFGFLKDAEALRAQGLARGASLDNAVVINGENRILNEGGLRFADEFVRHKVLDSVGDLYLAGGPICGHYRGIKAGHRLNNQLLRALFADPRAYAYTWLDRATGAAVGSPASVQAPLAASA